MPRKPVPIVPDNAYHVTARSHNQLWFDVPMELAWQIMENQLYFVGKAFQLRLHAFVLMSNHFHLLVTAPLGNLSPALRYLLRETSREFNRCSGKINQTWGSRNHKTCIDCYHHFMNTYKYLYRNPVRAGLCKFVEEYPYSTVRGLCGLDQLIIPLAEDTILFTPTFNENALRWLNTTPDVDHEHQIKLALRNSIFKLPRNQHTSNLSSLEFDLL